jgi:uncharacterized protein YndB with AHSA1/START domain
MTDERPDAFPATEPGSRVTREVEVEADADEVWSAISDPELRSLWLDDADARSRDLRLDEVDEGHRMVWTWWRPDDQPGSSTVEIVLAPTPGGTRVVVTETLAATPTRASVAGSSGTVALRAGDRWSYRLLGLELLLVAAGVLVR